MGNNTLNYLKYLNKHIKIAALAQLCWYDDSTLRKILKDQKITHKQALRMKNNLKPRVESILDWLTEMDNEIKNAASV